ncbi:MAG: DMT family transporter [Sphingomonadaceae bacterium]|nr:DMT family transporter [Sphingomonadaceae bacterium]
MGYPALAFWSFLAGVGIPLVGVLNSGLARALGSPFAASAVVFAVAFAAAILATRLTGPLPPLSALGAAPPTSVLPGLIMGFYALSATIVIPRFGVGNFVLFVLVAQVATAAAVDQFGLLGVARRPVDTLRAAGLGLTLIGLAVTQIAAQRGPR